MLCKGTYSWVIKVKNPENIYPNALVLVAEKYKAKNNDAACTHSDGVILDTTGKFPGRGAYLHLQQECITKGINGTIARALKTELSEENLNQLDEILRNQLSSLQNLQTEQISTIQN